MNFDNAKQTPDQLNVMSGAALRNQYGGSVGSAIGTPIPNETLTQIQSESVKAAYELCSQLNSIADLLGGPVPETNGNAGIHAGNVKGSALELRGLIHQAMALAQRIGSHL